MIQFVEVSSFHTSLAEFCHLFNSLLTSDRFHDGEMSSDRLYDGELSSLSDELVLQQKVTEKTKL